MLGGGDWEGGICLDSATDRALTHEMDRMRHSRLISKTQQQSRLMLANETDQRLHDGAWIPLPKSQLSCTRFHLTSPLRLDGDKAHASGPRRRTKTIAKSLHSARFSANHAGPLLPLLSAVLQQPCRSGPSKTKEIACLTRTPASTDAGFLVRA